MSRRYKALDLDSVYFITLTTVGWVDVFTRLNQKYVIIDALKYCQKHKGLEIYAYVLMHNHLHMLCKSVSNQSLAEIIRDFKKYTSKKIIKTISEEPESRRQWLLKLFKEACSHLNREQKYKVWQDGYHAKETFTNFLVNQKIDYIHKNPVKNKLVVNAEDYYFSSARNYAELDNDLDVEILCLD